MTRLPMHAYAELHAHSYFSLLDGVSTPEALAGRAAELGLPALALTDHDNLIGAVEFVTLVTRSTSGPSWARKSRWPAAIT